MAETKEAEKKGKEVKTGWVVVEFIKDFGSYKKGDEKTYHSSTAKALVEKEKVAKVVKELTEFVPEKAKK